MKKFISEKMHAEYTCGYIRKFDCASKSVKKKSDCDLKELQLLLQAPEERVFENTLC